MLLNRRNFIFWKTVDYLCYSGQYNIYLYMWPVKYCMDTGSASESDGNSVEDHDTVDISNVEVRNFYDFVNSLLAG